MTFFNNFFLNLKKNSSFSRKLKMVYLNSDIKLGRNLKKGGLDLLIWYSLHNNHNT